MLVICGCVAVAERTWTASGAVDMARLVLQHGRDPATRMLAEEIIADQTIEIEGMTRRQAALRQQASSGAAQEFPSLG